MKPPKLIITKQDISDKNCKYYNNLPEGEFDAGEEILKHGNNYKYISWLIRNCKKAQTDEWLAFYKSLNPDYENVACLIAYCKKAQTDEWFNYFKSLKPYYESVSWLIISCEKVQTQEWFEYYLSLKPDIKDVSLLTLHCDKARNREINAYMCQKLEECFKNKQKDDKC
jgi:hypothetical protein